MANNIFQNSQPAPKEGLLWYWLANAFHNVLNQPQQNQKIISPLVKPTTGDPYQAIQRMGQQTTPPPQPVYPPDEASWMATIRKNDPDAGASSYEMNQVYQKMNPSNTPPKPQINLQDLLSQDTSIDPTEEDFINKTVLPITRKYGIPDAVAAGQFAAEGRLNGLGASRNNFFNINAVDSNPNAAFSFATPKQGIDAYARYLTGQLTDANGNPAYPSQQHQQLLQNAFNKYKNNPVSYIQALSQAGYAGDPSTYGQRANNGYSDYAQFIASTPEFRYYLKNNR